MIKWHKKILDILMEKTGLNAYQVAWISFFKGTIVTVIIYEFIL